jgi:hypothetical protein
LKRRLLMARILAENNNLQKSTIQNGWNQFFHIFDEYFDEFPIPIDEITLL